MKIKHYASSWPEKLKIPLTKKEDKFFRFLELSNNFEKAISSIRKKYHIPTKGFSYRQEGKVGLGIPKYLEDEQWDEYLEDEEIIADAFGFVGSWGVSLSYFIKYNYMPKMAEEIVPRAAIFDADTTLMHLQTDYPSLRKRKISITINQKLSKKQLKDLIDLQWDQISDLMEKLPAWDQKKHINIEIFKRLVYYREVKKLSWPETVGAVSDEFPDKEVAHAETSLRNIYSRYSKRLQELSIDSVSLS